LKGKLPHLPNLKKKKETSAPGGKKKKNAGNPRKRNTKKAKKKKKKKKKKVSGTSPLRVRAPGIEQRTKLFENGERMKGGLRKPQKKK